MGPELIPSVLDSNQGHANPGTFVESLRAFTNVWWIDFNEIDPSFMGVTVAKGSSIVSGPEEKYVAFLCCTSFGIQINRTSKEVLDTTINTVITGLDPCSKLDNRPKGVTLRCDEASRCRGQEMVQ